VNARLPFTRTVPDPETLTFNATVRGGVTADALDATSSPTLAAEAMHDTTRRTPNQRRTYRMIRQCGSIYKRFSERTLAQTSVTPPVLASSASVPSYKKLDAETLQAAPGSHPAASPYDKGIGQALGVQAFGLYQVELPPGQETVAHDHAADGAEDVYAVIRGTGAAVIDGEEVALAPGEFIAVQPQSVRYVRAGADGIVYIAVCASARA
jgi:quercetin dioxygenase-like cupin family protein